MDQAARWGKKVGGRRTARPSSVIGLVVVLLMLIAPAAAMAQTATGDAVPAGAFDIVIAPELFDRATAALNDEDFRRAELDFSLFILLNPTFSPAYYYRAMTLLGEQEFDRAMQDYDQAVATSATFNGTYISELLTARADLLTQNDQFSDALADYSQAISLQPSATAAFVGRGMIYMRQNDFELARGDFDSAIGQQTNNPALYLYRALIISQLDEPRAAAADYLEFLNLIETISADDIPLTPGNMVSVQMDFGVTHRLNFEAQAGQQLSAVAAGRSATVDPLMVIVNESGEPLIADDDSGGRGAALIQSFTIPADGTYTLIIGHSLGGYVGQIVVGIELRGE